MRGIRSFRALLCALTAAALVLPAAGARAGGTVYFDGVAYEDRGVVRFGGGDTVVEEDLAATVVDTVLAALGAAGTCAPKSTKATISEPAAHVYYGALDSIYVWDVFGEAEVTGCPDNTVTVQVRLFDQALDGTSPPATGEAATGSGKARAGAVADLLQRYSNLALASGLSYHQLTASVTASQTDGKTATAWCAKKSWTYLATLTGPRVVGTTPTERVKCGA